MRKMKDSGIKWIGDIPQGVAINICLVMEKGYQLPKKT